VVSLSNLAELDPKPDSLRIVEVEHGDGGSDDRGSPDKRESHPFKVALPALPAGIEEANDFAGAIDAQSDLQLSQRLTRRCPLCGRHALAVSRTADL
jgi:hypothetical protein